MKLRAVPQGESLVQGEKFSEREFLEKRERNEDVTSEPLVSEEETLHNV